MKTSRNLIPKIGLALVLAFFIYGWAVAGAGATGSPMEVFGLPGTVLLYAAVLSTFATMFIAVRRAYRARSWLWLLAVLLAWPLSYVYALVINRNGEGSNNSSKPMPLRGTA